MTFSQSQTIPSKSMVSSSAILPWLVWGLACVFYFYECLLQVSPSVMSHELMRDFYVTSQTLGILSGIYFYSYATMQLPCGLLLDYFGPRRLLTMATLMCAISTIAFGLTDNFFMACIARLMIGFGSAFAAVGAMKFADNWFRHEYFPLLTGMMVTIGMLGAIGGETPLALLVDFCGWRNTMTIMGCIGLVIALLIFTIAKDAPKNTKIPRPASSDREPLVSSMGKLIKNKQLWIVAIYGGLMYMATPIFCGLWGVPFLMFKMQITKATAANYISLVFVGWAIASPLWGIYSNRLQLRKPPMYIGTIGALTSSLFFIYAPTNSALLIGMSLFLFGIFSAGFLTAFSVAKELCNKRYVATGLSFMNMMNMIGIALGQPAIGYVLDKYWQGDVVHQVRIYPLEAYHIGLSLLPIGMLIALLILPFVRETYCKSIQDL